MISAISFEVLSGASTVLRRWIVKLLQPFVWIEESLRRGQEWQVVVSYEANTEGGEVLRQGFRYLIEIRIPVMVRFPEVFVEGIAGRAVDKERIAFLMVGLQTANPVQQARLTDTRPCPLDGLPGHWIEGETRVAVYYRVLVVAHQPQAATLRGDEYAGLRVGAVADDVPQRINGFDPQFSDPRQHRLEGLEIPMHI